MRKRENHESNKNITEMRIPEQRGTQAPRIIYERNEHLHNRKQIVQYLDVQIQGRQNATMVSVCVKGEKARAEEQCA